MVQGEAIMKRTFERILFMLIGALIASYAYFTGNTSNDVNAQGTQKDKIQCDALSCHRFRW